MVLFIGVCNVGNRFYNRSRVLSRFLLLLRLRLSLFYLFLRPCNEFIIGFYFLSWDSASGCGWTCDCDVCDCCDCVLDCAFDCACD